MDVFGSRVVGGILRKVDVTLIITVESEFLLMNSQLSDELTGFCYDHVLDFRSQQRHNLLQHQLERNIYPCVRHYISGRGYVGVHIS